MRRLFFILFALVFATSCDPVKRHQRMLRKHPELIQTIEKKDTVRLEVTKFVECPDGSIVEVRCDTVFITKTNTIQLPPTNAQIRQIERTKRKELDNMRRMYSDSLEHVRKALKLANKRNKDDNRNAVKVAKQQTKKAKAENRSSIWVWVLVFSIAALWAVEKCLRKDNSC